MFAFAKIDFLATMAAILKSLVTSCGSNIAFRFFNAANSSLYFFLNFSSQYTIHQPYRCVTELSVHGIELVE